MERIIIERELGQTLGNLKANALLYDAHGRPLGIFSPVEQGLNLEDASLEPLLSIEDTEVLRKRARESPGKQLEEILGRLGF